ncbi:gustatory receptor 5a for trehalose-like [Schistocerca piceifrons]|uniref:gustatory receptor 5a for trehalose-like n=1 Tax=Schistocerca piceifrons TaxID=274613 RepID=UPI001F5F0843|nr:gustatory receptor 5a for trehalose-like [Schistocerca piceifrons]
MPWIPRDARRRGASLHEALRPMLVAAQVFALMPVEGLRQASPASLRYLQRPTEHILARLFNVVHAYECSPGGLSWLQLYLANEFPSAYHYIGFSYWTSAWLATINTAATFSWNYMDLFLILISLALADRFEHFNQDIARVFDRAVPQKIWQRIRENYCSLAHLAHATNARINKIVLLSFTTNLYFICYQLLNMVIPVMLPSIYSPYCYPESSSFHFSLNPSMLEMVYRCWSFAYLVARTCAVSLSAARVYEKSHEPKRLLFLVHPKSYGVEVQRLLDQINSDEIALTGFNFFSITRTFMLTVAGTIVTYEIVLVQFNNVSNAQESNMANKTFCSFEYY